MTTTANILKLRLVYFYFIHQGYFLTFLKHALPEMMAE